MKIEVREDLEAIIEHGSQIEELVSELTLRRRRMIPRLIGG